jgi:hypothetical protein
MQVVAFLSSHTKNHDKRPQSTPFCVGQWKGCRPRKENHFKGFSSDWVLSDLVLAAEFYYFCKFNFLML